jgi:hypothetical protein
MLGRTTVRFFSNSALKKSTPKLSKQQIAAQKETSQIRQVLFGLHAIAAKQSGQTKELFADELSAGLKTAGIKSLNRFSVR